jgi:hypothetical protein
MGSSSAHGSLSRVPRGAGAWRDRRRHRPGPRTVLSHARAIARSVCPCHTASGAGSSLRLSARSWPLPRSACWWGSPGCFWPSRFTTPLSLLRELSSGRCSQAVFSRRSGRPCVRSGHGRDGGRSGSRGRGGMAAPTVLGSVHLWRCPDRWGRRRDLQGRDWDRLEHLAGRSNR